jgi:hypothetical protein
VVLDLLRAQLKCNGTLVYQAPEAAPQVFVKAEESLHELLGIFVRQIDADHVFDIEIKKSDTHIGLRDFWICAANKSCENNNDMVAIADENLSDYITSDDKFSTDYELFSMPYMAVATGFVHNLCVPDAVSCDFLFTTPVVIDIPTAAMILDEEIIWWNDTRITSLNPEKRLPTERITVVAGPKFSDYHLSFVQRVRDSFLPGFAYRGGDDVERDTYLDALMDVALTAYSFSFTVFNATIVEGVERFSLINDQGVAVVASPETIEACAQDTYNEETGFFFLTTSQVGI